MYCWKLNVATVIVKLEIYLLLIIIYLFMQGWHENFKKICCENASMVKSQTVGLVNTTEVSDISIRCYLA